MVSLEHRSGGEDLNHRSPGLPWNCAHHCRQRCSHRSASHASRISRGHLPGCGHPRSHMETRDPYHTASEVAESRSARRWFLSCHSTSEILRLRCPVGCGLDLSSSYLKMSRVNWFHQCSSAGSPGVSRISTSSRM